MLRAALLQMIGSVAWCVYFVHLRHQRLSGGYPMLCYGVMGVCERLKHGSLSVKYAKRDKTRANTLNYVRFALTLQENSR